MTSEERQELRDQVAQHVMDWTSRKMPWAYSGTATVWHDGEGMPVMTRESWRPDEDDAQCMRVLDRMVERGFSYLLGGQGGRSRAAFGADPGGIGPVEDADRRIALLRAALGAATR